MAFHSLHPNIVRDDFGIGLQPELVITYIVFSRTIILINTDARYVSIGLYMPMFGLLAGGFVFTTLGLWFKLLAKENDIMWGGGMPDDVSVVCMTA